MTQGVPVAPPRPAPRRCLVVAAGPGGRHARHGHIPVDASDRPMDALAYVCGVVGTLALVFWRRWPVVVVGIVAITTAVYLGRGYAGGPALLPGPLALLAVGYPAPSRRLDRLPLATSPLQPSRAGVRRRRDHPVADPRRLGVGGGARRSSDRRRCTNGPPAERERADHAQRQVIADERLRIARDLHDTVAHAMATINVQSGVAAHLLDRDPAQAKGRSRRSARRAATPSTSSRAILGVLRSGASDGRGAAAPVGTWARRRRARRQGPRRRAAVEAP